MNASIFMLATVLATQSGNQVVSGTITNNSTFAIGMPNSIITPQGTGSVSGPYTFFDVYTCAGAITNGVFAINNTIPNGQANIIGIFNGTFNWLNTSYRYPGVQTTTRATLYVYQFNPAFIVVTVISDKTFP